VLVPCSVIGPGLHPRTLRTLGVIRETWGMAERALGATDMAEELDRRMATEMGKEALSFCTKD
jgi:hypothetical protein